MKILHIIGFYDPRNFFREVYYTQGLAKVGHEVTLLTSTAPIANDPRGRLWPAGEEIVNGVRVVRYKPTLYFKDLVVFDVKSAIREYSPDLVHIYEARQYVTYRAGLHCHHLGIPFVYEHEQRFPGVTTLGKIRSHVTVNRWLRGLLPKAAAIRTVTPGAKNYLLNAMPTLDSKSVTVDTLGYDGAKSFAQAELRKKMRRRLGLPINALVIGFSGKLDWSKRPELVIDAFARCTNNINTYLVVVGSGKADFMDALEHKIKTAGPRIILVPSLFSGADFNEFLNATDYMVWTKPTISYFEALGAGARIIIPFGDGSSHLNSTAIRFYGKGGGLDPASNRIIDESAVREELTQIFSDLVPFNREKVQDISQFEVADITARLEAQYREILENSSRKH